MGFGCRDGSQRCHVFAPWRVYVFWKGETKNEEIGKRRAAGRVAVLSGPMLQWREGHLSLRHTQNEIMSAGLAPHFAPLVPEWYFTPLPASIPTLPKWIASQRPVAVPRDDLVEAGAHDGLILECLELLRQRNWPGQISLFCLCSYISGLDRVVIHCQDTVWNGFKNRNVTSPPCFNYDA